MTGFRGYITDVKTIQDALDDFINDRIANGLSTASITAYEDQIGVFAKHIDFQMQIGELTKADVNRAIKEMLDYNLSRNSIQSYVRSLRVFLRYCRECGFTMLDVKPFKGAETVPETYTDEELILLLKKPNMKKCRFSEYRTWVMVNLLVDSGIRSSSLRCIQNQDVEEYAIRLRHTKNKKSHSVPLSQNMSRLLRDYMKIRKGKPEDYLFPNLDGKQMTPASLRHAIVRYNESRGVEKTSVHAFRHTFARMYLVECGGDALKLQRLLGHSTLDMTKHYVRLFDDDLIADFQKHSPLDKFAKDRITMPKK